MEAGQEDVLKDVNFTGGIPQSNDLAPSILFAVLYFLTIPVLIWRLLRRDDRTTMLIRPAIFVVCRIAMLIIRAILSQKGFILKPMIAELVMVSIGFLFLIEPVIDLWRRHIASCLPLNQQPAWVRKISALLKTGLIAAIATGVAGASQTGSAFDNPDTISQIRTLREVSYIVSLVVVGLVIFAVVSTHFVYKLDVRKTGFNLIVAIPLLIVAIFRVVQTYSKDPDAPVRSVVAFWVLMITFEFIAYCLLLSISLPTWYPAVEKVDESYDSHVEMAENPVYPKRAERHGRLARHSRLIRHGQRMATEFY